VKCHQFISSSVHTYNIPLYVKDPLVAIGAQEKSTFELIFPFVQHRSSYICICILLCTL